MKNIAETLTPIGNRILVEVLGPLEDKSSLIVKPDLVKYPQFECKVLRMPINLYYKLDAEASRMNRVLIGNMAGLELHDEAHPEKKYRLITPKDILLILE